MAMAMGDSATTETRLASCYVSGGGCGNRFEVPKTGSPVPSRCPDCRSRAKERKEATRGRLYDCEGCGVEFRYERHSEEVDSPRCNDCVRKGRPCMGGCGVRSKDFVDGNMYCSSCKPMRAKAVEDRVAMIEQARAAAAARAVAIASGAVSTKECLLDGCSVRFLPSMNRRYCSDGHAHEAARRSKNANRAAVAAREPLERQTRVCRACSNTFEPRTGNQRYCDEPACKDAVPVKNRTKAEQAPAVVMPATEQAPAALPVAEQDQEQPIEEEPKQAEVVTMARQATCEKDKGGCGKMFKAAASGMLPKLCAYCKPLAAKRARQEREGVGKPRASEPAKSRAPAKQARKAVTSGEPVVARSVDNGATWEVARLYTVRVGALTIDCHSVEALDMLVQRYGAAS